MEHEIVTMDWREAYPASTGIKCVKCGAYRLGWVGCNPEDLKGQCKPKEDMTSHSPASSSELPKPDQLAFEMAEFLRELCKHSDAMVPIQGPRSDAASRHYQRARQLAACYEAGSAAAAQAVPEGFVLVPREPTFEMNKAGQEAVWDFHPDDTIEGNEETARAAYFAMLAAAPTQGAEGAAPQAVVGEASELFAIANDLHGEFDKQTYEEKRKAGWDLPDDYEFSVTITVAQERALSRAIIAHEKRAAATPSPTPTAPQEADALREALVLDQSEITLAAFADPEVSYVFDFDQGARWAERMIAAKARAALAQHQPQQGEGA